MKLSDKHRWYADMLGEYGRIEFYIKIFENGCGETYSSGFEESTHYETGGGKFGPIPDTYTPK